MVKTNAIQRIAQRTLFPCQESDVKSTFNGSVPVAKLSTYMKSRDALWRLLATYPGSMSVTEAVRRARIDFTKCRKEGAVC